MLKLINHMEKFTRDSAIFETATGYLTFDAMSRVWTVRDNGDIYQEAFGDFTPNFDEELFEQLREFILEDASYSKMQVVDAESILSKEDVDGYFDLRNELLKKQPELTLIKGD